MDTELDMISAGIKASIICHKTCDNSLTFYYLPRSLCTIQCIIYIHKPVFLLKGNTVIRQLDLSGNGLCELGAAKFGRALGK